MWKGEEGEALPLTVKVMAFGTDLNKNKQTGSCLQLPNSFLQIRRVVNKVVKLVACSCSCLKGFLATGPGFLRNWPEKYLVASLAHPPTCLVAAWRWDRGRVVDGAGGGVEVPDALPGRTLPAGGGMGNVSVCTFPILLCRTRPRFMLKPLPETPLKSKCPSPG